MRRFELTFAFIKVPLDYILIVLAGLTAYSLRYTDFVTAIRPVLFNLSWQKFFPALLVVALGWIAIYSIMGLYTIDPNRKFAEDLLRIASASSTGFAGITIYVFFTLQKFDSRFLVLAGWILAMVYVALGRLAVRTIKAILYRSGIGLRKTVIIGDLAGTIGEALSSEPRYGYKISAAFERFDALAIIAIDKIAPDEIIYTSAQGNHKEAVHAIDYAFKKHISFKYSADLFSALSSNFAVSPIAGIPFIEIRRTRLIGWGRIAKRVADIVFGSLLLILFSPIMAVCALIILIETGRPIIYKNERVGQKNKKFLTLKFRSMHQKFSTGEQFGKQGQEALQFENNLIKTNSIKNGPVYKIANDPRVTPFGKFMRRLSLDELPQFWNVIRGDMSLVGPRPHQPREVEKYADEHSILLEIKPGITGLAQISGRSNLTFDDEARLDTFYVENWNLYLDLIILIKTPFVVFRGKGAL